MYIARITYGIKPEPDRRRIDWGRCIEQPEPRRRTMLIPLAIILGVPLAWVVIEAVIQASQ